jgi:hypothetical protein
MLLGKGMMKHWTQTMSVNNENGRKLGMYVMQALNVQQTLL